MWDRLLHSWFQRESFLSYSWRRSSGEDRGQVAREWSRAEDWSPRRLRFLLAGGSFSFPGVRMKLVWELVYNVWSSAQLLK
jgi:hypothetical protein